MALALGMGIRRHGGAEYKMEEKMENVINVFKTVAQDVQDFFQPQNHIVDANWQDTNKSGDVDELDKVTFTTGHLNQDGTVTNLKTHKTTVWAYRMGGTFIPESSGDRLKRIEQWRPLKEINKLPSK